VSAPLVSGVEAVRERAALAGHALAPRVDVARGKLAPYAATARESLEEAVEWAGPRVEEARGVVREKAATAATSVAPKVAAALGTAAAVSAPLAHEARERGEAALHALRGELPELSKPPEEKRRWPTAVLFLGIGALIGFAAGVFAKRTSPVAPGPYAVGQPVTSAPVAPVPTAAPESVTDEPGPTPPP
jgi:hypothetical protein